MSRNPTIVTMAEVTNIEGEAGAYTATVQPPAPRFVSDNCTGCGDCGKAVEAEFDDRHSLRHEQAQGRYLPHVMAHPMRYVIDLRIIGTDDAQSQGARNS